MINRLEESVNHIVDSIESSVEDLDFDNVKEAVNLINDCENVFVYGSGRSGLVGRTFAMRLMQLGLNSFFIGETITPAVKDNDCVFFVSKTGETQTAIQAAGIVSERVEADIIVLTASPRSTLANYADVIITLNVTESEEDTYLAPLGTVFEDSAMIFLDGFVAVLMDQIGEDEDGMRYRHPILI